MTLRKGDLVRYRAFTPGRPRARLVTGVVVQFRGDLNVRLFCDGCEIHSPFTTHVHPVGSRAEDGAQVLDAEDGAVRQRLIELSRTKGGRAAIKASRSRPDLILVERDGKEVTEWSRSDDWYGTGPGGGELPPGKGTGSTDRRLMPLRLASKGNPKEWHADFAHYLGYWVDDAVDAALEWLQERHTLLFNTLFDYTVDGMTVDDIATRDGIGPRGVHLRLSRARSLIRTRIGTPEAIERMAA